MHIDAVGLGRLGASSNRQTGDGYYEVLLLMKATSVSICHANEMLLLGIHLRTSHRLN